jgi:hypothetical protein
MRMKFLGDFYDVVRQSLIRSLSTLGKWSVHPMFTETVSSSDVRALEHLLGAKVISTEILRSRTDRSSYFECAARFGHLFLDPDTGLRMRPEHGKRGPQYLFASDLVFLSEKRPESLTLVFDQPLARGRERPGLIGKLGGLRRDGTLGIAYASHACFILASRSSALLSDARTSMIDASRLPEQRFLAVPPV